MSSPVSDSDQRLVKLEENVYFLEEQLKALDGQITAQQTQLDSLLKQVDKLHVALTEVRDFLASGRERTTDPVPPHHVAKFW